MVVIAGFLLALILLTPPLGSYMHRVYSRDRIGRLEGLCYRILGVNPNAEQSWGRYAGSLLWFSAISMAFVFVILADTAASAAQPGAGSGRQPLSRVQHRGKLHDQHQLAGVRR